MLKALVMVASFDTSLSTMLNKKIVFLENENVKFYILNGELMKICQKKNNMIKWKKKLTHLMLGTAIATS